MSGSEIIAADYARTGVTTCKACSATFSQGALRLGLEKEEQYWTMVTWYCPGCFPGGKIMRLSNLAIVKGIDSIRKKD